MAPARSGVDLDEGDMTDRDHFAAPAARANAESVAPQPTAGDRAGNPPSHSGTGDTPKPIKGGVSDRQKPINGPDPDSRVWETPVHTPAPHATPGDGSVPREGTEPVAWAVEQPDGEFAVLAFNRQRAECYATASDRVVPLYRHPQSTLTDAEVTFLLRERDLLDADDEGDRKTLEIIAGLLARLGGGR